MKKPWLVRLFSLTVVFILGFGLLGTWPAKANEAQSLIFYDTPHPILSDTNVRKALAYCTDRPALIDSVYPLLTLAEKNSLLMDTFIPPVSYLYDDTTTKYPYSPAYGQGLLDTAGWTLAPGDTFRKKGGNELVINLYTTNSGFRITYLTLLQQQWQACGVHLVRYHIPANVFFGNSYGAVLRRGYDLAAFAWVGSLDPGGRTLYACDNIPRPVNNWAGQNYMGWCEPAASDAIIAAGNSLLRADRISDYATVQNYFADDMVSLPLFARSGDIFVTNANFSGLNPAPGSEYYTYNANNWAIPGYTTIKWGLIQEPDSLWDLYSSSWVSHLMLSLINSHPNSTLNYDLQPILLDGMPTLENGKAANNTVMAGTGARVALANGYVANLAPGMVIINASGDAVTFTGTPVAMKQLTVQYVFKPNIKWSDGTNLAFEDFSLYKRVLCDLPQYDQGQTCLKAGNPTSITNGYSITYIPGAQSTSYSIPPYLWYPAHRIIQSAGPYHGKRLDQVPSSDWGSLPEVTRTPIGVGPYILSNWTPGVSMTFDANPYFVLGTPATQHIMVQFLDSGILETRLLDGSIDIAGSDAVYGVDNALRNADTAGTINLTVLPSATWEHLDMNLNIFFNGYLPTIGRP